MLAEHAEVWRIVQPEFSGLKLFPVDFSRFDQTGKINREGCTSHGEAGAVHEGAAVDRHGYSAPHTRSTLVRPGIGTGGTSRGPKAIVGGVSFCCAFSICSHVTS